MASDMRWNPVSVNFNDASAFMRNAGDSLSKAGTVFGELRKSILDEEQRAIENAYKEKMFNENVRQFDTRLGWDKDKFSQEQAWNREKFDKEQELSYAQLAELAKYHQASIAQQARGNNLAEARWNREVNKEEQLIRNHNDLMRMMEEDREKLKTYTKQEEKDMLPVFKTAREAQQNITDLEKNIPNARDADDLQRMLDQWDNNMQKYQAAQGVYSTYQANHMPTISTPINADPVTQQMWYAREMFKRGSIPGTTPYDAAVAHNRKIEEKQTEAQVDFDVKSRLKRLEGENQMRVKRFELGNKDSLATKALNNASPAEQQNYLDFRNGVRQMAANAGKVPPSEHEIQAEYVRLHMPSNTWLGGVFNFDPTSGVFGPAVPYQNVQFDKSGRPLDIGGMNILNFVNRLKNK